MPKKEKYIASYRMPVGFDNPPVNMPVPNEPTILWLSKGEVTKLKEMLPDIKIVKAQSGSTQEEPASQQEELEEPQDGEEEPEDPPAEEEPSEEEPEEGSSDPHLIAEDENFPGAESLANHKEVDLSTVEAVVAFSQDTSLTEVDGIGKATADRILKHIKENYPQLLKDEE